MPSRSPHILLLVLFFLCTCSLHADEQAETSSQPSVLQMGGLRWELVKLQEGQGSLSLEPHQQREREGRPSLRLVKTSSPGMVALRTVEPIKVRPKVKYTFGGYFHCENATQPSALLFRVVRPGQPIRYDDIDRGNGIMSQTLLWNSPPGQWERRACHFQTIRKESVHLYVILVGNPATVWLADVKFAPTDYTVDKKYGPLPEPFNDEQVRNILAGRANASAEVRKVNGRASLLIDGQVVTPAWYKGRFDNKTYPFAFQQAGMPLRTIAVQMGFWQGREGLWLGEGQYDFDRLDGILAREYRKNPHGHVVIEMIVFPPKDWCEAHPQAIWRDPQGRYATTTALNVGAFVGDLREAKKDPRHKGRLQGYPSYHSPLWEEAAGKAMADIVGHLQKTPYWPTVIGFQLTSGHDGQFYASQRHPDCSDAAREAFQQWCREHYATIGELNEIWGTNLASFEEIAVPISTEDLEQNPIVFDRSEMDYQQFVVDSTWALRDAWAGRLKSAADKSVVVSAYGDGGKYLIGLAECDHLDIAATIPYYAFRRAGLAVSLRVPGELSTHYGKLVFEELDLRSWVGSIYPNEVRQMWIAAGLTPEPWDAIHRKLVGAALARHLGWWYFCMNHYFNDPWIIEQIGKSYRVGQRLWHRPPSPFRPEVAVFQSADSAHAIQPWPNAVTHNVGAGRWQTMALNASGVPHVVHDISSLGRIPLPDYKVYVFCHTTRLNETQRQAIEKLKADGRTIVWLHDSGYHDRKGPNLQEMSELVGMTIRKADSFGRQRTYVDPSAHAVTKGVPAWQGQSELWMVALALRGESPHAPGYPIFWIEDDRAQTLARDDQGRVVMALREYDDWTSIVLASPLSLSGEMLNNIARQAGAFVMAPAGQSLVTDGEFVSIHALRSGPYPLTLPPGCNEVINLDHPGKVIGKGPVYTVDLQAQQTTWLLLRKTPTTPAQPTEQ